MTAKEEVKRNTLIYMLNKYPTTRSFTEEQWEVCYKYVRTNALLDTITWKVNNLSVTHL